MFIRKKSIIFARFFNINIIMTIIDVVGKIVRRDQEQTSKTGTRFQYIYIDNSSMKQDGTLVQSVLKCCLFGDKIDDFRNNVANNVHYKFKIQLRGELKDWQGKEYFSSNFFPYQYSAIDNTPTISTPTNTPKPAQSVPMEDFDDLPF